MDSSSGDERVTSNPKGVCKRMFKGLGVHAVCMQCACGVHAVCTRCARGVHAVCTRCAHAASHFEGAQVAAQRQLVLGRAGRLGRRREQRAHLLAALLHVELARRQPAAARGRGQCLQQRAHIRLEPRRGRRRLDLDGLEVLLDCLGGRRRGGDHRRLDGRRHVALGGRRRVTGGGVEAGPEDHRLTPRRAALCAGRGPMLDGARGLASLKGRQAARDRNIELAVQPDVERLLGGRARLGGGLGQRRRVQLHVVLAARLHGG
eukprot:scaffold24755_cov63-Phaeocystis_antarctica.AAC.9